MEIAPESSMSFNENHSSNCLVVFSLAGFGLRAQGLGFRVKGSGFRATALCSSSCFSRDDNNTETHEVWRRKRGGTTEGGATVGPSISKLAVVSEGVLDTKSAKVHAQKRDVKPSGRIPNAKP